MARYAAAQAASAIQGWWRELQYKRFWAQDDPSCLCSWCVCYPEDKDADGEEEQEEVD
jgi:hypothetical protein